MFRGILVLSPITYKVNEIFKKNHDINITAQQLDPDAASVFTFSTLCCAGNMAIFEKFFTFWGFSLLVSSDALHCHSCCDA